MSIITFFSYGSFPLPLPPPPPSNPVLSLFPVHLKSVDHKIRFWFIYPLYCKCLKSKRIYSPRSTFICSKRYFWFYSLPPIRLSSAHLILIQHLIIFSKLFLFIRLISVFTFSVWACSTPLKILSLIHFLQALKVTTLKY